MHLYTFFFGHHLLVAKLRSSNNVNTAGEVLPELKTIIRLIREKWQDSHIAH